MRKGRPPWERAGLTNMSGEDIINCTISHEIHQYLFSGVYILVLVIGLPANVYSLYHAWQQLRARNELGIYLLNLTVSDLLYLASLPLWLQYIFEGDDWTHKEWLCQLCGFLLYENIYISIGFLCCISIDRYLAVVYPFRFARLRSMRAAAAASAFVWLKEVAVGVVFFHRKELSTDRTNQSVCFEHYPMRDWERPVNYYRFLVGFLFPLGILSASYFRVLRAVNKSAGTQSAQKTRIKHLVTSTIVIFLVCFSPYHLFLLVRTVVERTCPFIESIFNYYHFSLMLTSFNCVADPVLYCFVGEFAQREIMWARQACARALCCGSAGAGGVAAAPGTNGTCLATPVQQDSEEVGVVAMLDKEEQGEGLDDGREARAPATPTANGTCEAAPARESEDVGGVVGEKAGQGNCTIKPEKESDDYLQGRTDPVSRTTIL